jgi:hypothetical protein
MPPTRSSRPTRRKPPTVDLGPHAKSLGMRHQKVAEAMHNLGYDLVDASTISRYMTGNLAIPPGALPYLAAALRVPMTAIHQDEDADEEPHLAKASGL